jgi:hypothetical protein
MIPIQFLLSTQQSIRSDAKHYSLDTYFFSITLSCACKKSSLAWQIKIQTRSIHFLKLACIVLSNQSPVIQRIYHRIQKSKIRSRCTSSFNKKAIFTVTNDLPISPCPKPRALIPLNCHAPRPGPVEWQPPRAYRPGSLYTRKAKKQA